MSCVLYLLLVLFHCSSVLSQCSGSALQIQSRLFETQYIQSPNFTLGSYPQNLICSWRFETSNSSSKILYKILLKGMVNTDDILQIFQGSDDSSTIEFDSTNNPSAEYTATRVVNGHSVFIKFITDNNLSNDGEGFELYLLESDDWSGEGCTYTEELQSTTTPTYITSPNFPTNYPKSIECSWNISSTTGSAIFITILYMDLEVNPPTNCYDYLTMQGSKLCAQNNWSYHQNYTFNDAVEIRFFSDDYSPKRGFILLFSEEEILTTTSENIISSTPSIATSESTTTLTQQTTSSFDSSTSTTKETLSFTHSSSSTSAPSHSVSATTETSSFDSSSGSITTETSSLDSSSGSITTKTSTLYSSTGSTSTETSSLDSSSGSITTETSLLDSSTGSTTTETSTLGFLSESTTTETSSPDSSSGSTTAETPSPDSSSASTTTKTSTLEFLSDSTTTETSLLDSSSGSTTTETSTLDSSSGYTTTETSSLDSLSGSTRTGTSSLGSSTDTIEETHITDQTALSTQHPSTTVNPLSTQNLPIPDGQIDSELSLAEEAAIIAGTIIGVAVIGIILGSVAFLAMNHTTKQKANIYRSKSRGTTREAIKDNAVPKWIRMIDTMQKQGYNPTFMEKYY